MSPLLLNESISILIICVHTQTVDSKTNVMRKEFVQSISVESFGQSVGMVCRIHKGVYLIGLSVTGGTYLYLSAQRRMVTELTSGLPEALSI